MCITYNTPSLPTKNGNHVQDKFEQLRKELPQVDGFGCEIRVKGLGFQVQRAKGTADEPTVGDEFASLGKCLLCLPLLERLRHKQEMESKNILKDVTAIFKPATTTLVLGPPGCGKVCSVLWGVFSTISMWVWRVVGERLVYVAANRY